tara:strand:- start:1407 stop:1838 length:432 start_codon:yes stop_codon:yes gene_type:complete
MENINLEVVQNQIEINNNDIINMSPLTPSQDPYLIIVFGLITTLISGVIFAKIMQTKLENWETKKISPMPFGTIGTISSWAFSFFGLTILFTGALEVLSFSVLKSLIASLIVALISGSLMWYVIKDLLQQLESGKVKEIDEYF